MLVENSPLGREGCTSPGASAELLCTFQRHVHTGGIKDRTLYKRNEPVRTGLRIPGYELLGNAGVTGLGFRYLCLDRLCMNTQQ